MNEAIIAAWNTVVQPDDVVLHLGDFAFGSRGETQAFRARLNGRLWLVLGNHDRTATSIRPLLQPDDVVERRLVLLLGSKTVVCRHNPAHFSEDHDLLGDAVEWWHGHMHDRPSTYPARYKLFGVDVHGPAPVCICDLNQVTRLREVRK
jgi:calcineurin-like phosphoesterase family protein